MNKDLPTDISLRTKKGKDPFPPTPQPPAPNGVVENASWSSQLMERPVSENERVRAVSWTRGEEQIITLQWLTRKADGIWDPLNTPGTPLEEK